MMSYETTDYGETFVCVDNGHTMRFDWAHYRRVRKARELAGLAKPETQVHTHPLIGKRVRLPGRDDVVVIETVDSHFYLGYYEHAVYRTEGTRSHGVAIVKNISSRCPAIIDAAEEFAHATLL